MVCTAIRPSPGSVLLLHLGSSSLTWLWGDPSTLFILLCLPSGCGHPFGSLVFFVTIDHQRRFPLKGFSFWVVASLSVWCRSFPTSSLSLSGLLVAGTGAFPWLVTVLTSTHLLLASSDDSPGALGVLPYFPPVGVMLCAHLQLNRGFLMLPACPSPSFGLCVYWFLWLLFSTRVPYLRDGVTPAGSRIVCPRSERRFGLSFAVRYTGPFLAGPPASVCGYLRARSLRVCCQVALAVSLPCGSP